MNDRSMKRRWLSVAATAGVFSLVLGVLAFQRGKSTLPGGADLTAAEKEAARNWSVWGGTVQRNLVNLVEKDIASDWSNKKGKEKNILWSAELGSKAYGGPIFSGGKIFIGTNNETPRNKAIQGDKGILMCFTEAKGEFLWQMVHDKLEGGRVNDWPEEGICSGPVVEGDRLWYVSNRCEVICATTAGLTAGKNVGLADEKYKSKIDGDVVWRLDMIGELGVFPHNLATCSPLIVGDTLFVITSNGVDEGHRRIPAPNAPSFLALDKKTGKVLWSSKLPGRNILHGQWSNPVYTVAKGKPQVIFPGGDGWLYSFEPKTGALIWKFDCNPKGAVYKLLGKGTKNDFVSTPVIHDDKLYIAVGQDPEHNKGVGHLWCIDITKTPANKDKDLSPWSDPKVQVPKTFDPKDPRNKDSGLVWHFGGGTTHPDRAILFGRSLSTCAVDKGLCYACDYDGIFFCLDAATGKVHWETNLESDTWSSPFVVDGKVYIGNEAGAIHVFEHSAKMKLVNKVEMDGTIRVTPVANNGVLYVVTEGPCRLWAIKAK